jgi:hypothetical protein
MLLLGVVQAQAAGDVSFGSYDLLQTEILTGTQASVTFSSLGDYATDYQHLQMRITARTDLADVADTMRIRFNSDSGSNYTQHNLRGNGSTVASSGSSSQTQADFAIATSATATANNFSAQVTDILDPFETTKYTTMRTLHGISQSFNSIRLISNLWMDTSAVDSILIFADSGDFVSGCRFSLYGLKASV